jgi:hypothetical protein
MGKKLVCLKFCCGSALDPDSMFLWIQIELKCCIRIQNESIRIHNPANTVSVVTPSLWMRFARIPIKFSRENF